MRCDRFFFQRLLDSYYPRDFLFLYAYASPGWMMLLSCDSSLKLGHVSAGVSWYLIFLLPYTYFLPILKEQRFSGWSPPLCGSFLRLFLCFLYNSSIEGLLSQSFVSPLSLSLSSPCCFFSPGLGKRNRPITV